MTPTLLVEKPLHMTSALFPAFLRPAPPDVSMEDYLWGQRLILLQLQYGMPEFTTPKGWTREMVSDFVSATQVSRKIKTIVLLELVQFRTLHLPLNKLSKLPGLPNTCVLEWIQYIVDPHLTSGAELINYFDDETFRKVIDRRFFVIDEILKTISS